MKRLVATLSAVSTLFLAGCGLGTAGGLIPQGELQGDLAGIDLEGENISIGSKNFTEQIILGKIGAILLQSAGRERQGSHQYSGVHLGPPGAPGGRYGHDV